MLSICLARPPCESDASPQTALEAVPGVVVVQWETAAAVALGLPSLVLRLPLPPVSVEEPPLTVLTRTPATVVVGLPITVSVCVRNRTALSQEIAVSVSDASGFVFAGERTSAFEVRAHAGYLPARGLTRSRRRCCRTARWSCGTRSWRTLLAGRPCRRCPLQHPATPPAWRRPPHGRACACARRRVAPERANRHQSGLRHQAPLQLRSELAACCSAAPARRPTALPSARANNRRHSSAQSSALCFSSRRCANTMVCA
jgi:hypothetical protein